MQTLLHSANLRPLARLAAAALSCALCAASAGCAAPRLQAQVDEASRPGACESAYLSASAADGAMGAGRPLMVRYLSATDAADAWVEVASACTARFQEGVMRGARAARVAQTLAARLGVASESPMEVDFGGVVGLDVDAETLDAMSLGEDRAGFAMEELAARGVAGATLAMSDNHKTVAQRLHSLAGTDADPRLKTYDAAELAAHPERIVDTATGLDVPTTAAVEMNCARAYLDAMSDGDQTEGDASDAAETTEATATTDAAPSTQASASDAGNAGVSADVAPSAETLDCLAHAAMARAWRAFTLGYPLFDEALFA